MPEPTPDDLANARDHFALFGLPRGFDVDESALQTRYLELTRLTHPDFVGTDPDAQERAMDLSARVNEAHRVLADPEERANYLLSLLGGPGKEEDKTLPPGFLERMLSVREEMADAQLEGDAAALVQMERQARERRQEHLRRVAELFRSLGSAKEPAAAADERLHAIRTELNALRYTERMLEQIHPAHRPAL